MNSIVSFFQPNPLIAIFLTLGAGFWLGKLKYKSCCLGPVAATLVAGVLVGMA